MLTNRKTSIPALTFIIVLASCDTPPIDKANDLLSQHIKEYTDIQPTNDTTRPYRKGKMVIIKRETNTLDIPMMNYASVADLRASKPEEVETIVWLYYEPITVGTYSGSGDWLNSEKKRNTVEMLYSSYRQGTKQSCV